MEYGDHRQRAALIDLTETTFPLVECLSFRSDKVLFTTAYWGGWCHWYLKIQTR